MDWRYMAFWGASGVVMGGLLPWFDSIWERAFGREDVAVEAMAEHSLAEDKAGKESASFTDWALAVRGIGAFVGIAFAIVSSHSYRQRTDSKEHCFNSMATARFVDGSFLLTM